MFSRRLFSVVRPTTKFLPSGLHFARNTRPLFFRGSQLFFYNTESHFGNQQQERRNPSTGAEMLNFIKRRQFGNAMRLFEEAKDEQPEVFIYNLALRVCGEQYQPNAYRAEALVEEMKEKGLKLDEFSYFHLVHVYGKVRDFEKARNTIQLAESEGFEPNIKLYNELLNAYSEAKQFDEALKVLEEIKEKNLTPNYKTYASLITGFTEEGNTEKVNEFIEEMKTYQLNVPHNSIISGLVRRGEFDAAVSQIQEMQKDNIQPNSYSYGIIISGLLKQGNEEKAIEVFNEARQIIHEPGIYNNFVAHYYKQGDVEKAKEWLNKMNEDRIRFDRISMAFKNKIYPEGQQNEGQRYYGRNQESEEY